jgi:hypothetical protein
VPGHKPVFLVVISAGILLLLFWFVIPAGNLRLLLPLPVFASSPTNPGNSLQLSRDEVCQD